MSRIGSKELHEGMNKQTESLWYDDAFIVVLFSLRLVLSISYPVFSLVHHHFVITIYNL